MPDHSDSAAQRIHGLSGRYSPQTDEWCVSYCSQSVTGRFYSKEPFCRSVCFRKVFPHEVRNIIAFKNHRNVGPDGKARYSLPSEGQPVNLPRILGGKPAEDPDAPPTKPTPDTTKHWNEGWYVWTTHDRFAIHEKLDSMKMDLEQQQRVEESREQRKEVWQDYQDHLQKAANGEESHENGESSRFWGAIVPLRPLPEFRLIAPQFVWCHSNHLLPFYRSHSLLVPFPPDIPPFWDRISKLLAPSYKVIGIFRESVTSGEQKQFAQRIWDKAWSNEPFVLASRTCSRAYELWKDREVPPDEDDGKKGST